MPKQKQPPLPKIIYALPLTLMPSLEVFRLLEEHGERNDGAIDQEAADNAHDHGRYLNDLTMC
jgi:hypothetical protein